MKLIHAVLWSGGIAVYAPLHSWSDKASMLTSLQSNQSSEYGVRSRALFGYISTQGFGSRYQYLAYTMWCCDKARNVGIGGHLH